MCELVVARANEARRGRTIRKGTVMCADDPRVQGSGNYRPLKVEHHCGRSGGVEQMTAAPGEVRDVAVYRCDRPGCTATAKSPAGLAAHKRSHNGDSE